MTDEAKLNHLEWAIESRVANQRCSLRLLRLYSEYEKFWVSKTMSKAAQDLTSTCFSLWRAAFLAEKTSKRAAVFSHGKALLEKLVEDNTIAYAQDKSSKEWTFNFYARSARKSLQDLHEYWPDQAPAYVGTKRNARDRWDYCQALLDEAVTGFESLLAKKRAAKSKTVARSKPALASAPSAKAKRKMVRALTAADRQPKS